MMDVSRKKLFYGLFFWSLKAILFFAWLFGVIHVQGAFHNNHPRPAKIDGRAIERLYWKFADEQYAHAKKLGIRYGPEQYFDDLVELDKRFNRYAIVFRFNATDRLQRLMQENGRKGYFKPDDITEARFHHAEELTKYGDLPTLTKDQQAKQDRQFSKDLRGKIPIGYLLSMILAMLTFFIRMYQIGGIGKVFKADPLEFIVASVFWPWGYFKYPSEYIRRAVAESVIRETKEKVLAPLTVKEQRIVEKVASTSSEQFDAWVVKRRADQPKRRKFVWAFVATIIVSLLTPLFVISIASAKTKDTSRVQSAIHMYAPIRAGPHGHVWEKGGGISNQRGSVIQGESTSELTHRSVLEKPKPSWWPIWVAILDLPPGRAKRIPHIPIDSDCKVTRKINQTVGGVFLRQSKGGNENGIYEHIQDAHFSSDHAALCFGQLCR